MRMLKEIYITTIIVVVVVVVERGISN